MPKAPILRVGLVWMLLLGIFYGLSRVTTSLFGADYTVDRHVFSAVLATALVVMLVTLARRHLDRKPFISLGLALDLTLLRPLLVGALAWLAPFALGLSICLGFGLVEIQVNLPWVEILAFTPSLIILVFLLEALPEELAFRGYIQTNLAALLPPWLAVIIQAALFGTWAIALWLLSSGGVEPMQASLFFMMGAVLGMLRVITGSVWTGIGFHLAFQTIAQLLLNTGRGHFAIDGIFWLQFLALGALPFALAIPIIERFYRHRVEWSARPA